MARTLTSGQRLGPYAIVGAIGAGGMGEVYRARDPQLNRDVAIKVLLPALASDPERLARFRREAQVLASLNHPNIAHIHGLQQLPSEAGSHAIALVMELVEGSTLAERLAQGPIPLDEALPLAKQIADALDAAHEQGIIHRDLKPANIKVRPDGTVKVLDFGLAKAMEPAAGSSPGLSLSPTLTTPAMTQAGMIVGTAAYMSPEQASGRPVDKRTDLWALGVVLLEMLTGKPVFAGETLSHILAAVLTQEPDWTSLPPNTPEPVRTLLRRCLAKDRNKRLPAAAIVSFEIDDALRNPTQASSVTPSPSPRTGGRSWMPVASGVMAGIVVAAAALSLLRLRDASPTTQSTPVARWTMGLRPATTLSAGTLIDTYQQRPTRTALAWSPDGRTLVFCARRDGVTQLFLRQLDQLDAKPLSSTTGAVAPFFSPDGRWIGFWAAGELRKVPATGGTSVSIVKVPIVYGATWGEDDNIYFDDGRGNISARTGISRVSANGGAIEPVVAPDAAKGEFSYRLPQLLPGGKALIFTTTPAPQSAESAKIVVRSLVDKSQQVLGDGADARFVLPGYLVFVRRGSLVAAPFDVNGLKLVGGTAGVLDDVMQSARATSDSRDSGAGQFSVSPNGSLAYAVGGMFDEDLRSIVWVDRAGAATPLALPARRYWGPHLSPDGQRFAVDTRGTETRIWVHDLRSGTTTAISDPGVAATYPTWSPDGTQIVMSVRPGGLFRRSADGTGTLERLSGDPNIYGASAWSRDGAHLAVVAQDDAGRGGITVLTLNNRQIVETHRLSTPPTAQYPSWSPDGRWLVYTSRDSGREEVYVQPYPGPGPRTLVSRAGGSSPIWSRDGHEIFYAERHLRTDDPDHPRVSIIAVPVTLTSSLALGNSQKLFEGPYALTGQAPGFDVSPDGKRFLMVLTQDQPARPATEITVVQNWIEEVKRLLPAK